MANTIQSITRCDSLQDRCPDMPVSDSACSMTSGGDNLAQTLQPIQNIHRGLRRIQTASLPRHGPILRGILVSVKRKISQRRGLRKTNGIGPNPEYTPPLLTKLAEYRVSATFFLIGRNLKRHPEVGRRIVQEGHEVGNHTYNHRSLPFLSKANIRNELASTHQLIADLLNVQPVFLRPPNGLFTERVLDTVEQLGYRACGGRRVPGRCRLGGP